jgi:hypothetical protein
MTRGFLERGSGRGVRKPGGTSVKPVSFNLAGGASGVNPLDLVRGGKINEEQADKLINIFNAPQPGKLSEDGTERLPWNYVPHMWRLILFIMNVGLTVLYFFATILIYSYQEHLFPYNYRMTWDKPVLTSLGPPRTYSRTLLLVNQANLGAIIPAVYLALFFVYLATLILTWLGTYRSWLQASMNPLRVIATGLVLSFIGATTALAAQVQIVLQILDFILISMLATLIIMFIEIHPRKYNLQPKWEWFTLGLFALAAMLIFVEWIKIFAYFNEASKAFGEDFPGQLYGVVIPLFVSFLTFALVVILTNGGFVKFYIGEIAQNLILTFVVVLHALMLGTMSVDLPTV